MAGTDDSASAAGGTPNDDAAAAKAADGAAGSKQGAQDDSTLASRYAGQTAKVNELTGQLTSARESEKTALQKLRDYEAGKVGADEALKSQLEEAQKEAATARKEAALARIEAKYPETFSLFGEAAAGMAPEVLAASEARLKGVVADEEPPTPGSPNQNASSTRATKPKTEAEKSADDVRAELISGQRPW